MIVLIQESEIEHLPQSQKKIFRAAANRGFMDRRVAFETEQEFITWCQFHTMDFNWFNMSWQLLTSQGLEEFRKLRRGDIDEAILFAKLLWKEKTL